MLAAASVTDAVDGAHCPHSLVMAAAAPIGSLRWGGEREGEGETRERGSDGGNSDLRERGGKVKGGGRK